MWGLTKKVTTVMLAASSPPSINEVGKDFRNLYSILGEQASVYQQLSPTLRISHVTPPQENQDWTDVLNLDAELMMNAENEDNLFWEVANKHGSDKPLALYLPGLDGFGISAATWQFNDLAKTFDLWRLSVKIEDRSSFGSVVSSVAKIVEKLSTSTERPIYLIGESFGGLLAPAVSLNVQKKAEREGRDNPIGGLVMVNPATSFDQTSWDVLAPILSSIGFLTSPAEGRTLPFGGLLPSPYAVLGGLTLSALIPSSEQFQSIVDLFQKITLGTSDPTGILDLVQDMLKSFELTEETLPPGLLDHRIKNWLFVGSDLVLPRLKDINVPVLVVVGNEDKLIDSRGEVKRLQEKLPQVETLVVRNAGHFVLDENVNLTEAILYSKLDPLNFSETKKEFDPILDWKLPKQEVIDETRKSTIKPLQDAFSPVYMSTDANGKRSFDLDNIPRDDGPILFVANHQLLGLDLNLLISELIENDIVVRGLAHPIVFQSATGSSSRVDELGGRTPGLQRKPSGNGPDPSSFQTFGAVMVTPRNFYRVLQSGQNALLFPGGVREVFHGRDEAYQLFWPEKVDFVRMAARFNATIVPVSAVGMADSINTILEPSEVGDLPLIGERAKAFAANVTAARFDAANEDEVFMPPIVAPRLPSRNYFIFGKPLSTKDLDPSDKASCQEAYTSVQDEMKRGFDDILSAREKDVFKDAPTRLAYEQFTGGKAPTFDISEVNRVRA
ncbi:MAG: hypothetical protein SGBAC_001631 [Bacillariaceae sp.]